MRCTFSGFVRWSGIFANQARARALPGHHDQARRALPAPLEHDLPKLLHEGSPIHALDVRVKTGQQANSLKVRVPSSAIERSPSVTAGGVHARAELDQRLLTDSFELPTAIVLRSSRL